MRVLCLIDSLEPGGSERSLGSIAPHLVARDIDLHVAAFAGGAVTDDLARAGATVTLLDRDGGRMGRTRCAMEAIDEIRPHIVHTTLFESDIAGRLAARIRRVPVISSLVGLPYGPEHRSDPGVRVWKMRGAQACDMGTARFVARFHAVAEHVADVMGRRLRISRARIEVIPRGRDTTALGARTEARRSAARAALGLADRKIVFAASRHEHQKGLDVLLEAMPEIAKTVPDVHLVVAGREGNTTAALCAQIDRLGLLDRVTLLGARDDVADLYCAADAFALPSRSEGSPGALLEAMALGAPAVVSDLPATREILDSTNGGVLVPAGDSTALARSITRALLDREHAAALAARAYRRFAACYTIESVADRTAELYKRVSSVRSSPRSVRR